MKRSALWILLLVAGMLISGPSVRSSGIADAGTSHALIVVGLPGDLEHDAQFRSTAARWKDWLIGSLGFPDDEVRILSGCSTTAGSRDESATRERIGLEVERLRKQTTSADRVWVIVMGHANIEDGHAFLHIPGPDLRDDVFAAMFRGLGAGEQVFWMTTAASGAFLPALSANGRVVIAATERSGESNETEFPHALAEVSRRPADRLDLDQDKKVSVLEIFEATAEAVESRFKLDKRAQTEHAQIDDNGDGVGTGPKGGGKSNGLDGPIASKIFLPMIPPRNSPKTFPRSDHGTDRAPSPAR